MTTRYFAGVDEAGRGPVIGPLVIAGIVLKEENMDALMEWGVRDSKQLTPQRRERLEPMIRGIAHQVSIKEIQAKEIDTQRQKKLSLNTLEAKWMAQVLNQLDWDVAYVDASDVDANRYGRMIQEYLSKEGRIISEHKADFTYPIVAAASILAKVRRDQRIRELRRTYGDFGSGYPNDLKTRQFLEKWISSHENLPICVRHTWDTVRKILSSRGQQKLNP